MEEKIKEYLRAIYIIAVSKGGDIYAPTIPSLNTRRMYLHDALFQELVKTLHPVEGFTQNDIYWRSKELFSRLDKIFRLYNDFDLKMDDIDHIRLLEKNLCYFLSSSEVKLYLEGKTQFVERVIEKSDEPF